MSGTLGHVFVFLLVLSKSLQVYSLPSEDAKFLIVLQDKKLTGTKYFEKKSIKEHHCLFECAKFPKCDGVNYHLINQICMVLYEVHQNTKEVNIVDGAGWKYYEKEVGEEEEILVYSPSIDFTEEVVLERNKLLQIIPNFEKSWDLTFSIKLFKEAPNDRNILLFTAGNENGSGSRIPSIDVIDRTTKLRFYVPDKVEWNRKYEMSENLKLGEWHSVRMVQYISNNQSAENYTTRILVNGVLLHTTDDVEPALYQNVKVYTSSPWSSSAAGVIRDVKYQPNSEGELMVRNNLLETLPVWPKAWMIEFSIKVSNIRSSQQNVFHFTQSGSNQEYFPKLDIEGDTASLLLDYKIQSVVTVRSHRDITLPMNEFATIRIENRYINPFTYKFQVYQDNVLKKEIIYFSDEFEPIPNVEVYRSNNHREAPDAIIKNFIYGKFPEQPPSSEEGQLMSRNRFVEELATWPRAWFVEFSIMILGIRSSTQNVFQFTQSGSKQKYFPRLNIEGNTAHLLLDYKIQSVDSTRSYRDITLPMNEFVKIRITNEYINPFTYKFQVYQDSVLKKGLIYFSDEFESIPNVEVYRSNDHREAPDAAIKDFIYGPQVTQPPSAEEGELIKRNTLLETLTTWPRAWLIEFSIKFLRIRGSQQNVFQFTPGSNQEYFPRLDIEGNTANLLLDYKIQSVDPTRSYRDITLPINEFVKIRITNEYINPFTYKFQVYQDSDLKKEIIYYSNELEPIPNVKVYRSNNHREAADAIISNFTYIPQPIQPPTTEEGEVIKKNTLLETLTTWPRAWLIEFSIKFLRIRSSQQNVFQFTPGSNQEYFPRLDIEGNTANLLLDYKIQSVDSTRSNRDITLPMNEFVKIRITNEYINPFTYKFQVYQDSDLKKEIIYYSNDLEPIPNVKVYRSNNHREAADAIISNFTYKPQPIQPPTTEEGQLIVKNTMHETIPTMLLYWKMTFSIKILRLRDEQTNIIHSTTGTWAVKLPAVFLKANSADLIVEYTPTSSDILRSDGDVKLMMNQYATLVIKHWYDSNGDYSFEISIDGTLKKTIIHSFDVQETNNVKIYMSSNFRSASHAIVKDFSFVNYDP